jgi:hypothetical protein
MVSGSFMERLQRRQCVFCCPVCRSCFLACLSSWLLALLLSGFTQSSLIAYRVQALVKCKLYMFFVTRKLVVQTRSKPKSCLCIVMEQWAEGSQGQHLLVKVKPSTLSMAHSFLSSLILKSMWLRNSSCMS